MNELIVSSKESATNEVEMIEGIVTFSGASLNVYSFYIDGVLIDTGSNTLFELFQPWFQKKDIQQIFLTHNHEDHTGGAAQLQETLQTPIYIHEKSVAIVEELESLPNYRQFVWGDRGRFHAKSYNQTMLSTNYQWDVIFTPGHASDHVTLYCRELKILFTGDLFVQAHTKAIMKGENLIETLHSLKTLLNYDFEEVYCCHAGYLKNGRQKLQEKIDYLEEKQQIIKTLSKEGQSIVEIRDTLFPRRYAIEQFSNGEWGSQYIIKSILEDQLTV